MRLAKISISDFASFGPDQELSLSPFDDKPVLILGENMDSAGADSNGVGKSSLMHAVSWAIFGKTPNKVGVDEVVRIGADKAVVEVVLSDSNNSYGIKRSRGFSARDTSLVWSINGQVKSFSTDTESQKALMRFLGFQPKTGFIDFQNSAYFSMEAMTAFTSRSGKPEERMAIISRFLGLDVLDAARDISRDRVRSAKAVIDGHENTISVLTAELSNVDVEQLRREVVQVTEQITQLVTHRNLEFEKLNTKCYARDKLQFDLGATNRELAALADRYVRLKKTIESRVQQLSMSVGVKLTTKEELDALYTTLINRAERISEEELNDLTDEVQERIKKLTAKDQRIRSEITQLEAQLDNIVGCKSKAKECPHCHTKLMILRNDIIELDLEALETESTRLTQELEKRGRLLDGTKEAIADTDSVIAEIKNARRQEREVIDTGLKIQSIVHDIKRDVDEIDAGNNRLDSIDQDEAQEREKLESHRRSLQEHLSEYDGLEDTQEVQSTLEETSKLIQERTHALAKAKSAIESYNRTAKLVNDTKQQLQAFREKSEALSFWSEGFPTLRRWRIDKFLPSFEEETNRFLSMMETGTRVSLSTTRAKKSSKNDEKAISQFTITVTDENGQERSFETFSMGESRRIGIAVGFALRELTLRKGTNQLEFLLLDEVVDSLDQTGVDYFFNLLPRVSGLKLVISHDSSLISRFEHVITITKQNGIATIGSR